jgi:hypothetical protein
LTRSTVFGCGGETPERGRDELEKGSKGESAAGLERQSRLGARYLRHWVIDSAMRLEQ